MLMNTVAAIQSSLASRTVVSEEHPGQDERSDLLQKLQTVASLAVRADVHGPLNHAVPGSSATSSRPRLCGYGLILGDARPSGRQEQSEGTFLALPS